VASLGALENQVMECLWAAPAGLTATQVRDRLADGELALTTVHTLLTRLAQKGFVAHDEARPRRFRATASQADHVAAVMQQVLEQAEDRDAVLARFVGSVTAGEASLLRRLLRTRRDTPAEPSGGPEGGPVEAG
jgi:predicted transcriptional regulator